MNPEIRRQKLESYGKAAYELEAALKRFPREMWHFRDEHGCWSIHEHLVHIADSEANSYIRCRRLIAEPGKELDGLRRKPMGHRAGLPLHRQRKMLLSYSEFYAGRLTT